MKYVIIINRMRNCGKHATNERRSVSKVVFYEPVNNGYKFHYVEPSTEPSYLPKYHWEIVSYGDCSAKCGGGIQEAIMSCIEERAGKVSASFCQEMEKPEMSVKKCSEQPCKTKWRVGKWGKCHACKYKSGVRQREVECIRQSPHPGTEDILVEDKECKGPRPGSRELCNSPKKCKTRRHTFGLSDAQMEDIWLQMHHLEKRKEYRRDCEPPPKKPKIDVGKVVQDHVNPNEMKLEIYPIEETHLSLNLTDKAFETMGDKAGDKLLEEEVQVLSGKQAAEATKYLQHKNNTGRNI